MSNPRFLILYVGDVARSAEFYSRLLGAPVPEISPTFAMLPLGEGLMLGLWRRDAVGPAAAGAPGACELALALPDEAEVEATHGRWREAGAEILEAPTRRDFGYACAARDPDGHRLRAFAPA